MTNNEDETERGRLLVRSATNWWTEMAKCISDAQRAVDEDSDAEDATSSPHEQMEASKSRCSICEAE